MASWEKSSDFTRSLYRRVAEIILRDSPQGEGEDPQETDQETDPMSLSVKAHVEYGEGVWGDDWTRQELADPHFTGEWGEMTRKMRERFLTS